MFFRFGIQPERFQCLFDRRLPLRAQRTVFMHGACKRFNRFCQPTPRSPRRIRIVVSPGQSHQFAGFVQYVLYFAAHKYPVNHTNEQKSRKSTSGVRKEPRHHDAGQPFSGVSYRFREVVDP
jgi:hypothetical protein